MATVCLLVTAFILVQCVPIVLGFDNYEVGLVAHWRLDEDYWNGTPLEVTDSSGNGNHGIAQNGLTTTDGVVGKCGEFDGANDRIVFPNDLNPTPTSQITLMAWIKPENVGAASYWKYDDPIIGKRWSYALIIDENGRLGFHFHNTPYSYDAWVKGPSLLPYEGKWIHVAATYDGSYSRLYLNGELKTQASRSGPIYDSNVLPYISYVDYSRYFDGLIDEAMIYNRALDSAEINQYYQEIFTQNLGAGPDQTINEGEWVTFQATKIQPNPSTGLIFSWDLNNDGTYDYEETPAYAPDGFYDGKTTKIYPNEGTFIVKLKISDTNGVLITDDTLVTVNNLAPQTTLLSGLGIADNYIFVTHIDGLSYFIDINDDGTFSTPESVDDKDSRMYGAGIGDFDNDGDLDALAGDRHNTWYYEKTGDGNSFDEAVSIDSISHNYRCDFAEADYNNDGNLDAIMADWYSAYFTFYFGNGDGTFSRTTLSGPSGIIGMDAADFNNDGNMDFVAASWSGQGVYVYLGQGNGNFYPAINSPIGESYGVSAGDFNNDGKVDIIYGFRPAKFYPGNGDGTFGAGVSLGFKFVFGMAESDIDGDGNLDLMYTYNSYSVIYTKGNGDGTFSITSPIATISGIRCIATYPENQGVLEINEGESIEFEATFTDAGWLDTHIASWNWGDATPIEVGVVTEENNEPFSTGSVTGSHIFGDNGEYTIALTVTDDYGASGIDTADIIVLNVAPIANSGPDRTVYEGDLVEFDASASYDPGYLDSLTYEWNFGDANTKTGENPTHTYEIEGIYTVTLTVTDDDGESATDTMTVTVLDAYPSTDFVWTPEPQNEGSPIQFTDQTTSYDPIAAWSWDFAGLGTSSDQNPKFTFFDDGTYTVTLTVTDDDGSTNTISNTVTVDNVAPVVEGGEDQTVDEGNLASFVGAFSDAGSADTHTMVWDFGDGTTEAASLDPSHVYADNGVYTVTLTVTDDDGGVGVDSLTVAVTNVAPILNEITATLDPVEVNFEITASATFADAGILDTHTAVWDWGDETTSAEIITEENGAGEIKGKHAYESAGIYRVTLTIEDNDGASDFAEFCYIVVYDPSEGFVTGGGWINSPAGAYALDPELTGKATFGFVSKYKKGATVPTGNTKFIFHAGNLDFHSTSYDWLVIAGNNAKYKGTGTIKGLDGEYCFMLTATDGDSKDSPDLFRIKIWNKASGEVIYDNKMDLTDSEYGGTALCGGNIIVHKTKK